MLFWIMSFSVLLRLEHENGNIVFLLCRECLVSVNDFVCSSAFYLATDIYTHMQKHLAHGGWKSPPMPFPLSISGGGTTPPEQNRHRHVHAGASTASFNPGCDCRPSRSLAE